MMNNKGYATYQVMALSSSHLTADDMIQLQILADSQNQLVTQKANGFFVQTYAADSDNMRVIIDVYQTELGLSKEFNRIAAHAIQEGYRLIEFDDTAYTCPLFKTNKSEATNA
ncbi:hypothetical protein VTH8203_01366 [Vibrio thalassae]|uniref:DUF5983 domain-containing protein n=1 Tax=Vibrio thalassae TaxID=1243014 RepID=A0A240EGV9_9VIBR|nr:hypothetical protein [Vibrio thalassae]SNX47751.1 hypothetical protein VTH8203_01366 [Vibrio thalassae]